MTRPAPPKRVLLGAVALVLLLAALTSAGSVLGSVVAAGVGIMVAVAIATWLLGKPFRTTASVAKRDHGRRRSRSL